MKSVAIVLVTSALIAGAANAQIRNYKMPGSLQANAPLGCVDISAVKNENTPPDIYSGFTACIKSGEYEKGVTLFVAAGAFGYFDQLRVTDKSAHQASIVLRQNAFADFTPQQNQLLTETFESMSKAGSPAFKSLCAKVAKLGPPNYFPTYMVQHGITAFTGKSGNGVKEDFNAAEGWRTSLSNFVHCP